MHAMATNAFPAFDKVEPKLFLRALGVGEVALGAALLLPVVPAAVAGAGLLAFSGGLLGLYWRTPICTSTTTHVRRRTASRSPRTCGWQASAHP